MNEDFLDGHFCHSPESRTGMFLRTGDKRVDDPCQGETIR